MLVIITLTAACCIILLQLIVNLYLAKYIVLKKEMFDLQLKRNDAAYETMVALIRKQHDHNLKVLEENMEKEFTEKIFDLQDNPEPKFLGHLDCREPVFLVPVYDATILRPDQIYDFLHNPTFEVRGSQYKREEIKNGFEFKYNMLGKPGINRKDFKHYVAPAVSKWLIDNNFLYTKVHQISPETGYVEYGFYIYQK